MKPRLLIDLAMALLLTASFAYPFTENRFHELNGIALGILFAAHNALNRRWYAALLRGRYTFRRCLGTAINSALFVAMLATVALAVPISHSVFAFLGIDEGSTLPRIHVAAANWLFVLCSLHVGMHWDVFIGILRGAAKGAARVGGLWTAALRLVAGAIAIYGIRAALHRSIGAKLVMYYSFDFARAGDSVPRFIIDYFCIMGLAVWAVHYALKIGNPTNSDYRFKHRRSNDIWNKMR